MNWQPISSVPKEGRFDIWAKRWDPTTDKFYERRFVDCYWISDSLSGLHKAIGGYDNNYRPTHWMPIPDPPTKD